MIDLVVIQLKCQYIESIGNTVPGFKPKTGHHYKNPGTPGNKQSGMKILNEHKNANILIEALMSPVEILP